MSIVLISISGPTWEDGVTVDFLDILDAMTLKLCLTFKFPIEFFSRLLPRSHCKLRLITHLSVFGY